MPELRPTIDRIEDLDDWFMTTEYLDAYDAGASGDPVNIMKTWLEEEADSRGDDVRCREHISLLFMYLNYQDVHGKYSKLLDDLWGLVYPGQTDWEYPGQVQNHLQQYIEELKAAGAQAEEAESDGGV